MSQFQIVLTVLYAISSAVMIAGYVPTLLEVWRGKPSASFGTYLLWSSAMTFSLLYAMFVVADLLLSLTCAAHLVCCLVIALWVARIPAHASSTRS
jgi:hypothetical protein